MKTKGPVLCVEDLRLAAHRRLQLSASASKTETSKRHERVGGAGGRNRLGRVAGTGGAERAGRAEKAGGAAGTYIPMHIYTYMLMTIYTNIYL